MSTPVPRVRCGAAGGTVSRMKAVVPAVDGLPAASVAMAETLMVPSPRVVRSADVRTTGTAVEPLPVMGLVTELAPFEKTTETEEPDSAVSVMTPDP